MCDGNQIRLFMKEWPCGLKSQGHSDFQDKSVSDADMKCRTETSKSIPKLQAQKKPPSRAAFEPIENV